MQFLFSISWLRRFAPRLAIVSVALLLLAPLAACSSGSSSASSSTSSGPVNLTEKGLSPPQATPFQWQWLGVFGLSP